MSDYINIYHEEYVEGLKEIFNSGITTTFSTLVMGLALVKVIETIANNIRNSKRHFYCTLYYFHLFTIIVLTCHGIFTAHEPWANQTDSIYDYTENWEIPLSFHYFNIVHIFMFIFSVYFSIPSSDDMNKHFLSLKDFYKKSSTLWLLFMWGSIFFLDMAIWLDRSLAGDIEFYYWCYDSTLSSLLLGIWDHQWIHILGLSFISLILQFRKDWLYWLWYLAVYSPLIIMILQGENHWIDMEIDMRHFKEATSEY